MKKILMLGTSLTTKGGISSVVNVYKACDFFEKQNIRYITTHRDGNSAQKALTAAQALLSFWREMLTFDVSAVHIHVSSRASFWRKAIFAKQAHILGVPVILHLHGSEFDIFYEQECTPRKKQRVQQIFDSAAHIITLSENWKKWVGSISKNKNISVIYNPIILPERSKPAPETPATLLFLGRLGKRKGTYDLLHAIAMVSKHLPEIRAILAGDGDKEGALKLAKSLGIDKNVNISGWISGAEKNQTLSRSHIYVLPSYNEGLPMSILEAMARGLPVISTPIAGIPEAIESEKQGFLVPPGDVDALAKRIKQLAENKDLRNTLGESAREKCRTTFSADVILPQIESLYNLVKRQ